MSILKEGRDAIRARPDLTAGLHAQAALAAPGGAMPSAQVSRPVRLRDHDTDLSMVRLLRQLRSESRWGGEW